MTLKIIGAGLGRTGTMSMKLALEQLGFGPCYHMTELLGDMQRLPAWLRVADGEPDWDAIFAGFAATVDFPACSHWRELAAHYPDAKVLLTVRDPDSWFDSVNQTIFSAPMRARVIGSPLEKLFDHSVWHEFGDRIEDRDFMTAAFQRHVADVERAIPAERLLVYEIGQGWGPLCAFLGVPVPDEPFPHTNSRDEMLQMIAELENLPPGEWQPGDVGRRIRDRLSEPGG